MLKISEHEIDLIRQWGKGLVDSRILAYTATEHPMDDTFKAFGRRLAELAPTVNLKKESDAQVILPTLFVGRRVAYQALPLDRELRPFLMCLAGDVDHGDAIAADVRRRLARLDAPALVKVYVTPHCPFCPATVSTLLGLAALSDQIRVTVIDGEMFPEAAQADRIGAAPTVILDDQFRWMGSVDAAEMVRLMLDRDPADLGAEALRGVIEDGNAEQVARMMVDRQLIFNAFRELLIHPRWSVRLGAMVAFESLVELDPDLAGQIVEPLVAVFPDLDDMVKGDLLHVIGESGNRAALPFLISVTAGEVDAEVRSAAEEAIEKLT